VCLAPKVARLINSVGVIEALADAMCLHGIPERRTCYPSQNACSAIAFTTASNQVI
jgi:hypothetical protein